MEDNSEQKASNERAEPSRIEKKYNLVEALAVARSNYLIGYHFWAMPVDGRTLFLEKLPPRRVWDNLTTEYKNLVALMGYRHIELQLWENYRRGLGRALIKESFELTLHYCRISGQSDDFRVWKHFRFIRLLRNAMSHTNGSIIKWTYGKESITWRDYTYTPENDGDEIRLTDEEGLDLQKELQEFVDEKSVRSELSPIRRIRSGGLAAERSLGHGPIDASPFPVDSAPWRRRYPGASGHGGEDFLPARFRESV